ncbi:MAG: hypothetical protein IT330_07075 [Anaerolineae bacterium]|nr:hypothetical protein [Anaerolineae bacterium]
MASLQADNYDLFQKALAKVLGALAIQLVEESKEEFGEALGNRLYDLDGPRTISREALPLEKFHGMLLEGVREIDDSFQIITHDIPFYISHFPPRSANVSRTKYLQYHIGNYLNQIYILRERMEAYRDCVLEAYHGDSRLSEMGPQLSTALRKFGASCTGTAYTSCSHLDPRITRHLVCTVHIL